MTTPSPYEDATHEAIRAQIRRFVDTEVRPHGDAWETEGRVPRAVLRRMGELGFLGIRHPVDFGGIDAGAVTSAILAEELGHSTYGGFSATVLVHTDMASPHLRHAGSPAQKDKYLPGIVRGDIITAIGVTEADAGSDVAAMRMTARRGGNGFVLNGAKMFITNGVHADLCVIAARTDPDAKGAHGISLFLVEKGTAGFRVGRALDKHGWRCSDTAELVFEDCRLSGDSLLGVENEGFYAIMKNFQNERLCIGALAVGEARTALDLTIAYTRERKAFGGTLFDKQVIRHRLAMLEARVAAARQLVYHAAWLMDRGVDAVREVSMVKALCGELVNDVMYACVQFHGGAGYMRESPIERMSRDARILAIGGGATEIMLEEVAKRSPV